MNGNRSKRGRGVAWLVGCAGAILLGGWAVSSIAAPAKPVDHEALAQKLVTQCAAIKEGEIVLIEGGARDLELLEDIAVEVRKQGAFPLLTVGSDRMTRKMVDEVPAKFDAQKPELALELADKIDAIISVDFGETDGLLAHVPPERLAARAKAAEPVGIRFMERGVRQVNLGNGLHPTATLAKRFGLSEEELSNIYWGGVNVDYTGLQSTGDTVRAALAGGKEVVITHPNGTNLKARIEKRQVLVSDGVISAEEMKKGGPAVQTWLPAGEVYVTAVPGTGEGKVVVDHQFFQGKEIEGLTLTFAAGKLTSMTAKSGLAPLKALYDASGTGKDIFGIIDLGINPNVKLPSGSKMQAWMPAGMVTVGFGGNDWAGGENRSTFAVTSFLPGTTVKVDGKTIVENGKLKI